MPKQSSKLITTSSLSSGLHCVIMWPLLIPVINYFDPTLMFVTFDTHERQITVAALWVLVPDRPAPSVEVYSTSELLL